MWAFLFGGRLTRLQYAVMAIPLVALQYVTPLISIYAPMFFGKVFGAHLATFSSYMIALSVVLNLLVLVLTIVSAKRLRDIGLTGWLALPIPLKVLLGVGASFLGAQAVADGTIIDPGALQAQTWVLHGLYYYSYALALFLLIVPGRNRQAEAMTPAPAL